jgi:hypothetical protein
VFRFSVLYTAQCTGDAGRTIYIHGLYKSGAPVADYYGSGDGICVAVAVSFLDIFLLIGKNTLIG